MSPSTIVGGPASRLRRLSEMSSLFGFMRRAEPCNLQLKVTVIIQPDGNAYHAYSPGLKGLHVDGSTVEEALDNAKDAVLAYLDSLATHGDPLPLGPDLSVEEIEESRVPAGAFLRSLELQWSHHRSGIS
jgi:predicted RNase H-like HicB family nuclease